MDKFISAQEAMHIADISQATLYNYLKDGKLTRYKVKGKLVLKLQEVLDLNKPVKVSA